MSIRVSSAPLGNADAHGSAQAGSTGVLEQATRNDGPDEVELRVDGNPLEAHCRALLEVPEDKRLNFRSRPTVACISP